MRGKGYSGAPARGFHWNTAAGALVMLLAVAGGCRQDPPPAPAPLPPSSLLQWRAGDTFTFDTWATDQAGLPIPSSRCTSARRILRTGLTALGASNVTAMLDSIALPGTALQLDTLYFYQSSEGDLWQFGLVASINRRYNGTAMPPAWDRLAALSLGAGGVWTAGQADTASQVTGTASNSANPWVAALNGTSAAFTTEQIDLSGPPNFGYTVLLSTAPPVFALIIEPSSAAGPVEGLVRSLTAARLGG